jgi:hypothetical protein
LSLGRFVESAKKAPHGVVDVGDEVAIGEVATEPGAFDGVYLDYFFATVFALHYPLRDELPWARLPAADLDQGLLKHLGADVNAVALVQKNP